MKFKIYTITLVIAFLSNNSISKGSTITVDDDPKFNISGNWILNKTYVKTDGTNFQDITFYNGLGSPEQIINVAASANNDKNIITPVKYDNMMRSDAKTYLPYVSTNNSLATDSSPFTLQQSYYTTLYGSSEAQYAYTEKVYEPSVLNRVVDQYNVGNIFRTNSKKTTFTYETNTSNDYVFKFDVGSTNNLTASYYYQGELYKNSVTNEDGTVTLTFTDKSDKKVLERTIAESSVKIDTYYAYDDLGRLAWVIQPEGSALLATGTITTTSSIATKYSFIYKYDGKGNVIEKIIPAKGVEYYVYDKGSRLVMSQDAKLRDTNDWLYYIYDNLDRLIEKNIVRGQLSRSEIQSYYSNSTFNNTYPTLGGSLDYRKPLPYSEFTFITCLEGSRYKNNTYYSLGSSQQYPLSLSGTYLLVHTDLIVNWGAYSNDYYNFYVMMDDNINNLYYICTDQNDPTIKYYYIPTYYSDIVQNIVEQDPYMTYEYVYTYPGSGTPLTSMTITSFFPPTLRAPVYELFSVPTYLAFESVSSVATTSELDNSYTHNELAYERQAILSSTGINGVSGYVERAFYYDYLGRTIQTVEKNHLGGTSRTSFKYNLAGNILKKHESHQRGLGLTADTKLTTFTYDVRGRMLTESTSINGSSSATVNYSYNELGQLTGKTYGNGATESMAYNIQGWLSSKNAVKSGTNLFSMNLLYYNSTRATNKYTGNIVEWQWTQGAASQNSYALSYDKLSRLTNSNRYEGGATTNAFTEKNLSYDKNGNITQLQRYGSTGTLQDNFTYNYNGTTYNGNQLSSISGSVSATYDYDNNGNMTTDGRKNLAITYNVFNLQQTLSQSGTAVANYSWLADGTKCAVADNTTNGYDYLGSLIYTRNGSTRTLESTDFGGGRIVYSGSTYSLYYYITDHLGSIRTITDNSGIVREQNDYYPFGGRHANGSIILPVNKQKFNGKELQTTGFMDYGARMYDDVIGRWGVVDPLGEKYSNISPYVYCANNPIRFVDIRGNAIGDPLKMMSVRNDSRSNTFGMVRQRSDGTPRVHQGIDYKAPIGTPIYAVKDGVVVDVIPESEGGDYGTQIIIEFEVSDGEKAYAAYAHLSVVSVNVGDKVYEKSEKAIGKTGDSGNAKGMSKKDQHLHFEYRNKQKVSKGLEGRDDPNKIVDTKFTEDPNNKDKVIKVVKNNEPKKDEKDEKK